jgi:hypothetical protein
MVQKAQRRAAIGTLLPLARHIVAHLATPVEEVTHDDRSPPIAMPAPPPFRLAMIRLMLRRLARHSE